MAIGNPFGLEQTLSRGVISGINRNLPETPTSPMLPLIQTDASIHPGNSGGPLLNRCGEVIGITTSILAETSNIGFAIPINIAKKVIPELMEQGRIIRPWIGVSGKLIKKEFMEIINMPLTDGFLVEMLEPGSPAQKAGLQGGTLPVTIAGMDFLLGGDIITDINGESVNGSETFMKLIQSLKVGDTVRLTVYREKKTRKIEFVLPERPFLPTNFRLGSAR